MDPMPKEGEQAPDFDAPADDGSQVSLGDLRGRKVVLYFYPKDDTPGCTREACEFRDSHEQYREKDAVVLGVSPDTVESHVRFRDKYDLPFRLLADPEHELAKAYGVWGQKSSFGNKYMGIHRTTFVIDEEGRIEKVFRNVKAKGHAEQILAGLDD